MTNEILIIDNYDSFVHNLARYLRLLGQNVRTVRNDRVTASDIERGGAPAIILSPGPCTPLEAGCCVEVVQRLYDRIPILGVCLGHQAIAQALGGDVRRADHAVHGQASAIFHHGDHEFRNIPDPFEAGRYHSLVVDRWSLPPELIVTAWTDDRAVMGIRHVTLPLAGWQFHPESILTYWGFPLLANWLRWIGLSVPERLPTFEREIAGRVIIESPVPVVRCAE